MYEYKPLLHSFQNVKVNHVIVTYVHVVRDSSENTGTAQDGTVSGNTTREETLGTNSRQRLGKRKDLVLFSTTRLRIAFGSNTESADRRADFPSSLTVDGTFRIVDWLSATTKAQVPGLSYQQVCSRLMTPSYNIITSSLSANMLRVLHG